MEDWLIAFLVMFVVSIPTITLVYQTKFNKNKRKQVAKTIKEENFDAVVLTYANTVKVLSEQNEFLVAENKTIKKRLAAEIGVNLKAELAQLPQEIKINSKNLEEHYEIDVNSGLKLIETMNIPFLNNMDKSKIPELMNNPMIKKKAWDYIKDNKDEMISLGVIVPKGKTIETESKEEIKEANPSGMMALEFSNNNDKYMA